MIQTDRLILSPYTEQDFDYFAPLMMSELVMRYITERALSLEETQAKFDVAVQFNQKNSDIGFYHVLRQSDQQFIGFAKLVPFDKKYNEAEVGYALMPEYWGNQYATEITARLVEYAQSLKRFSRLIGLVDPAHAASVKVLTKNGLTWYKNGEIDGLPAAWYELTLPPSVDNNPA